MRETQTTETSARLDASQASSDERRADEARSLSPSNAGRTTAQATVQRWIDAKERVATLDYGLRSIKECGGEHCCIGAHGAQLIAAKYEAARLLRDDEQQWLAMDAYWIRHALKTARDALKTIEAEKKSIGGTRQLGLALGDECDCHGCGEVRLTGRGTYYCDACIAEQRAEQGGELAAFNAYHEWADQIGAAA